MILCIVDHGLVFSFLLVNPCENKAHEFRLLVVEYSVVHSAAHLFCFFFFWQLLMNLLSKRVLQYFCIIVYIDWLVDLKRLHQQRYV